MEVYMHKCIYSLKTEPDAQFLTQEHIFPKTIGGINKLPLGMVSDEANRLFSPLEKDFVHNNPIIQMEKMFHGPKGRKGHDKKDNIRILCKDGSSNHELGYIQLGVPYSIPQLVIPLENLEKKTEGKNQLLMNLPYVSPNGAKRVDSISQNDVESELLHPMLQCIDAIEKGKSRVQIRLLPKDTQNILIGYFKDNLSLGFPKIAEGKEQHEQVSHALDCIKRILLSIKLGELHPHYSKNNVTLNLDWKINLYQHYRVVAKIAFNCLAKICGQEFVLQPCFDQFRKAILTGQGIERFVQWIPYKKSIPIYGHLFGCIQMGHILTGQIIFYNACSFRVTFTDSLALHQIENQIVYICDLKKQNEYDLDGLAHELAKQDEEYCQLEDNKLKFVSSK